VAGLAEKTSSPWGMKLVLLDTLAMEVPPSQHAFAFDSRLYQTIHRLARGDHLTSHYPPSSPSSWPALLFVKVARAVSTFLAVQLLEDPELSMQGGLNKETEGGGTEGGSSTSPGGGGESKAQAQAQAVQDSAGGDGAGSVPRNSSRRSASRRSRRRTLSMSAREEQARSIGE